jgi:GntR family transcriptional regulator
MNVFAEPELVLEGGDPVPLQLEGQIRRHILHGALRPGEELPTVRSVSVGLSVNPHAVEEAYEQLEREGFLTRGEGCGPRVAALAGGPARGNLDNCCRDFLRQTADAGYSPAEALQTLHAWIDRSHRHGESR